MASLFCRRPLKSRASAFVCAFADVRSLGISVSVVGMLFGAHGLSACSTVGGAVKTAAAGFNVIEYTELIAPPRTAPDDIKKGIALLEDRKFADALAVFDGFLAREPVSPWTQSSMLNAGRALEGLERWTDAAERYRIVVKSTNEAPKLQAMALYRLSFCHEALGNEREVVAALSDVVTRSKHLPKETANAELPARLATAYARVGNFDRATDFYKQAEGGIARLRAEAQNLPEWLPRTLYYMGMRASSDTKWGQFEATLRPFARGQVYLLQAAELGDEAWSSRAAEELMSTYSQLWRSIESAPVPDTGDPLIARRELQEQKWNRASLLMETIVELRARFLPSQTPSETTSISPQAKTIVAHLQDVETKIRLLLNERKIGEGLTPEAESRRKKVRGKVLSPDSTLERKFLRGSRNSIKIESPKVIESEAKEDPNL